MHYGSKCLQLINMSTILSAAETRILRWMNNNAPKDRIKF